MENEVVVTVLNEVLVEQKELAVQIENLQKNISLMTSKLEQFEQRLNNLKVTAPPVDLSPTRLLLIAAMEDVKKVVAEQPKEVVHQKRYLLFPEYNAKDYYGAVFKWMFYLLMGTYAFSVIKDLVDHWLK